MKVLVVDMQVIDPPVGGGRLRLLEEILIPLSNKHFDELKKYLNLHLRYLIK